MYITTDEIACIEIRTTEMENMEADYLFSPSVANPFRKNWLTNLFIHFLNVFRDLIVFFDSSPNMLQINYC